MITVRKKVDSMGRVMLPSFVREALKLQPGAPLEISLSEDGTITMKATPERCCVCDRAVTESDAHIIGGKYICKTCAAGIRGV